MQQAIQFLIVMCTLAAGGSSAGADAEWVTIEKYLLKNERYIWTEARAGSLDRNGPWVHVEQRSRLVTDGVPEAGPGYVWQVAVNCLTGAQGATSREVETESGELITKHVTLEELERDAYARRVRIGSGTPLEQLVCGCDEPLPAREPSEAHLQDIFKRYYERQRTLREMRMLYLRTDSYEAARAVIERLDEGEPFAELVQKFSSSKEEFADGDLGFHHESRWSLDKRRLLRSLRVGEHTREPVDGLFGYEIFLKKEERELPPSYDAAREAVQLFAIRAQQCRWAL